MTTFPSGTISPWGTKQALRNNDTWISYKGIDGTIFYLSGPLAPVAGAQNGLVLKKFMGLMSPFENLELRGARQDGATWTDAVYDVGDIMLGVEASGTTPENIRDVIRHWISAWDAKKTGILSVFTPDMGEWWANVRMGKTLSDQFEKDYTWSGKQPFSWNAKNYDAFWYSVDSTSEFAINYDSESEDFTTQANAATLDGDWTQLFDVSVTDTYGIQDGVAVWIRNEPAETNNVININTTPSSSDNQIVSIKVAGPSLLNLFNMVQPGSSIDAWTRLSSDGQSGVRLRLTLDHFSLSRFTAGVEHNWFTLPLIVPPFFNDTFTLIAGTDRDPYEYVVQRDGFNIFRYTDSAHSSAKGSTHRHWGFGAGVLDFAGTLLRPHPLKGWTAADNLALTQTEFLALTNLGDVEAWPRYLIYGPGTFTINNGPGSDLPITFGPLVDGQVVLLTTDPRLRSVVDVTPASDVPTQNSFQQLMGELISFATNNRVPPLLQQFESTFGILPPQGNLYTLLNGRFTNPIPAGTYGSVETHYIKVTITDGGPSTKVVAAITPRRRWPL